MIFTVICNLLIYICHAVAAMYLSPLRFSKTATFLFWALLGAIVIGVSIFAPPLGTFPVSIRLLLFILIYVLYFAIFIATTVGRLVERVFLIISFDALFCSCYDVNVYLRALVLSPDSKNYVLVFAITLAAMMYILLKKLLPTFREIAPQIEKGWWLLSTLMALFFAAMISYIEYPNKMGSLTTAQVINFFVVVAILYVTYGVIFISLRNMAAAGLARQMDLRLKLLSHQVESQRRAAEEACRIRHDLRHHNYMLATYARKEDTKGLLCYLNQHQNLVSASEEIYCENDTINNILVIYGDKAREKNIRVDILAQAARSLPISDPDLVAIIGNLFENAINGAAASGDTEAFIRARVHRKAERLVIHFENSCRIDLSFEGGIPASLRGVGIGSVLFAAQRYGGECDFSAKNGVFKSVVLLDYIN